MSKGFCRLFIISLCFLCFSPLSMAENIPTFQSGILLRYKMMIYEVALGDTNNNFSIIFSSPKGKLLDMSVIDGETADGELATTVDLPPGTYTQLRILFNRCFQVSSYSALGCTDPAYATPLMSDPSGFVKSAAQCNVNLKCKPKLENICIPTGKVITYSDYLKPINDHELQAMDVMTPLTIVSEKPSNTKFTLKITNVIESERADGATGACIVFPEAPKAQLVALGDWQSNDW